MRVPVSWLRDYVAVDMPLPELADRLSISVAEVEGVLHRGVPNEDGNLGLFRVGRVVEAGKHPSADRLQLCQVDVGEGDVRQIVCGAWNFGAGAAVAVALPGAVLPDGRKLESTKLRGELSNGMILAEDEIELGVDHAGIMLLPDEWEPGTPLADKLALTEDILLVESTGNRPDLLSVYGIAREVAALYGLELAPPPGNDPTRSGGDKSLDLRVDDFDGCPRYVGRLFCDVAIGPSPAWLRTRLSDAGMRPITNVVDVTNYVMLALGNPLHAFDYATLAESRIVVRRAKKGEELRTLDGELRKLDPDDLLIADAKRSIALAGIMGGEETEITEATTDVLLEAANFDAYTIFRTSERLRLRTEGSNRWEKGVDPYLAPVAATMATELIVELAGARWVGHGDVQEQLPERTAIRYRPERADELIGIETSSEEQHALLRRLEFDVKDAEVIAPTWRARDVTREVDVVEEIARFRMDQVPFTYPLRREMFGRLTRNQRFQRRVEEFLSGVGFSEVYTASLVERDFDREALRLLEPISGELAVLRTTLLPSLVEAARRNAELGNERIDLFEIARVYLPSGGPLPTERIHVAGIAQGGFSRAKGVVEALAEALEFEAPFRAEPHALFHPSRSAATTGGAVGELHPSLLEGEWCGFELFVDELAAAAHEPVQFREIGAYPAVHQDIAVVVDAGVRAAELLAAARKAAGPDLREARFLSDYRDPPIPAGKKSIAFSLTFQSAERTLTDEDAAELRNRIVSALEQAFEARLRT
ncbi:MAG: phenylalanine--tRNA ligase subunit beta [Actinobacteria bacterium]|nr:phenylalanine--tRNA ligase subunit beta [Actinomycetota bacterium]